MVLLINKLKRKARQPFHTNYKQLILKLTMYKHSMKETAKMINCNLYHAKNLFTGDLHQPKLL